MRSQRQEREKDEISCVEESPLGLIDHAHQSLLKF